MPTYDWECTPCKRNEEAFVPSWKDSFSCRECGALMEKVWTCSFAKTGAFPFVTKNFNGQPITVESESHLQRLCKEFNVVHRPDVAFIEKDYLGWNPFKKRQEYREGSGRGLPGQWI